MLFENPLVVLVEDLSSHKCADYGTHSVSDKGEADLGVV